MVSPAPSDMCACKDFFGRSNINTLSDRAYEPIWPLDLSPFKPTFQEESYNLAVSAIQSYLQRKNSDDFYHITISGAVMPTFLKVMDQLAGCVHTLPFSCWCDGGPSAEALYQHHRHMVILCPKGHFNTDLWNQITLSPDQRPYPKYVEKRKMLITSALHLVNTLGYLSGQNKKCQFLSQKRDKEHADHFMISTPLPSHYQVPCVMQWDGGILELIQQTYQILHPMELAPVPMKFKNNLWRIRVGDLPNIEENLLLPPLRGFKKASEATDTYLHLAHGVKVYFEETEKTSSHLRIDEMMAEEEWILRPGQQRWLESMKHIFIRNMVLEKENERLNQGWLESVVYDVELEKENKRLKDRMNNQLQEWLENTEHIASHNIELEKENARLKGQVDNQGKRIKAFIEAWIMVTLMQVMFFWWMSS